jgi:hypothetical protein
VHRLAAHQEERPRERCKSDGSPEQDETRRLGDAQDEPQCSAACAKQTGVEHDRGERAAVKGRAFHQGANDLEIFGSPVVVHGLTLHYKANTVNTFVSGARPTPPRSQPL